MIDEMKRGFKLIKYANDYKVTVVIAILFFVAGIAICLVDLQYMVLASIDIFMSVIMLIQMEYSLLATGICASSPCKRNLETWQLDLSGLMLGIAGYLILLVMILARYFGASDEAGQLCGQDLLFSGMIGGFTLLYGSLVYKKFLIGFIVYFSGFYSIFLCSQRDVEIPVGLTAGILGGFAFIILGSVAAGILRRLLYRKPLSKAAFGMKFRKNM